MSSSNQTETQQPAQGPDRDLASSVAWTGSLRWASQLASWAATLVLVRLLTPADYGIAGIASTLITWLAYVADLGFLNAIITGPELSKEEQARLFSVSTGAGLAFSAAVFGCAGFIGDIFDQPRLVGVLRLLSLALVFDTVRVVPSAVLSRGRFYRTLASVDLARGIAQTVLVVSMALLGAGYWSFSIGYAIASLLATILILRAHPIGIRLSAIGPIPLWRRAVLFLSGTLSWQTSRNTDIWITGKLLGASASGAISLTKNIASVPVEKLVTIVTSVAPGYLAAHRDDPTELRRMMLLLTEAVTLVVSLPLIGLILTADLFTVVVLGSKWSSAIWPLRFYSVGMIIWAGSCIATQVASLFPGLRLVTLANLLSVPLSVLALIFGAQSYGLAGAAGAGVLISILTSVPAVAVALHSSKTTWAELVRSYRSSLVASAVMIVAVWGARVSVSGQSPRVMFVVSVATGAIAALFSLSLSRSPILVRVRTRLMERVPALASRSS